MTMIGKDRTRNFSITRLANEFSLSVRSTILNHSVPRGANEFYSAAEIHNLLCKRYKRCFKPVRIRFFGTFCMRLSMTLHCGSVTLLVLLISLRRAIPSV